MTLSISQVRVWRFQKILERKTIDEGKARFAVKHLQLNWFAQDLVETDHQISSKNMYPGNFQINRWWSFWLNIAYIALRLAGLCSLVVPRNLLLLKSREVCIRLLLMYIVIGGCLVVSVLTYLL